MAGMWTHKDLIQGVYSFFDLLDAHEMLAVKSENEARAIEYSQREVL